jgi:hypothetical protein
MGEVAFPGSDRWALDCAAVGWPLARDGRWAVSPGSVLGREVLSQPVDARVTMFPRKEGRPEAASSGSAERMVELSETSHPFYD